MPATARWSLLLALWTADAARFARVSQNETGRCSPIERKFQACAESDAKGTVLMQFNVLADGMAKSQFGAHEFIAYPQRFEATLAEIAAVSPDVLCLQELNHYEDLWQTRLNEMGFHGIFIPKYDAAYPLAWLHKPPHYYNGMPTDGSAIFVKSAKLKFGKTVSERFADLAGDDAMTQVVIAAEVEDVATGAHMFTASTSHLKAGGGGRNEGLRKAQGKAWVELLKSSGLRGPFVATGDMNEDRKQNKNGGVNALCDGLSMRGAYEAADGRAPETTSRWGVFDYILISEGLRPTKLWTIPKGFDRSSLPSACYPSDHLSLAVELVRA